MLKETPKSLRLYFGIVAAFSLLAGATAISQGSTSPLVLIISLGSVVFGALFAYIVARFPELLPRQPGFIRNVLTAHFALSMIGFGVSLMAEFRSASVFRLLISALIYFYLLTSVNRLSAEAKLQNT